MSCSRFHPPDHINYRTIISMVMMMCVQMLGPPPVCRAAIAAIRSTQAGHTWTASLQALLKRYGRNSHFSNTPEGIALYQHRLRLMQGHLCWQRWLETLPLVARQQLSGAAKLPGLQSLADEAFSPGRQDRAAVVGKLTNISGYFSDAILDTLLVDPSHYVRLTTMNAFWKRAPDSPATANLFWMASQVGDESHFIFNRQSRTWSLAPGDSMTGAFINYSSKIRVRFHGKRIHVDAPAIEGIFGYDDQRRAANILIHWHSPVLTDLLLKALVIMDNADAVLPATFPQYHNAVSPYSLADYLRIFRLCRSRATAPYLLHMIDAHGAHAGAYIDPQGRYYYKSRRTNPLCLLMIDAGLNPTHFGIVKIGCSGAYYSPPAICALSGKDQTAAIHMIRKWCQVNGIHAAKTNLPDSIPVPGILAPLSDSRHVLSLGDMKYGLIGWLLWVQSLPPVQQTVMLEWGDRPSHIQVVSMAFAPGTKAQMGAARLLASDVSQPSQRLLAWLISSPSKAVALTAMNAFWSLKSDAFVVSTLRQLATAPQSNIWPPKRSGTHWTWALNYHGHKLFIRKSYPNTPFWLTQAKRDRKQVTELLNHCEGKVD